MKLRGVDAIRLLLLHYTFVVGAYDFRIWHRETEASRLATCGVISYGANNVVQGEILLLE
jgi:hypothetical protein